MPLVLPKTPTKASRFVNDPKAGAYCQIVLGTGEKVIVNHDKGGFACALDSPEGRAARSVRATRQGLHSSAVTQSRIGLQRSG